MTQNRDILAKFKLLGNDKLTENMHFGSNATSRPANELFNGFFNEVQSDNNIFNDYLNVNASSNKPSNIPVKPQDTIFNEFAGINNQSNKQPLFNNPVVNPDAGQKGANNQFSDFFKSILAGETNQSNSSQTVDYSGSILDRLIGGREFSQKEAERFNQIQKAKESDSTKTITPSSSNINKIENLKSYSNIEWKDNSNPLNSVFDSLVNSLNFVDSGVVNEEANGHIDDILLEKVAKLSQDKNTDSMEDIIKSREITYNELQKLFLNYVDKSVDEAPDYSVVLDKLLTAKDNNLTLENVAKGNVNRERLEELFINFVNETNKTGLEQPDIAREKFVEQVSKLTSQKNMGREDLTELFINLSRHLLARDKEAFKNFTTALTHTIPPVLTSKDCNLTEEGAIIKNMREAVKPEYLSRNELERAFNIGLKIASKTTPQVWEPIKNSLDDSITVCFTSQVEMDHQSRSLIDNFRMVIGNEGLTKDALEELFIRFARETSNKYPAVWMELESILSNALPNAFQQNLDMDDHAKLVLAGFAQAIKPEFMNRETLEELFTRYAREISNNAPAAFAELQSMLSVAVSNVYTPQAPTMDNRSKQIVANFSQAIKPEFMTRETLEELFLRFARELSTKFPAAFAELESMLGIAVANAFAPDITMDDSSKTALAGFAQAIKPEYMTRDDLVELYIRFGREISINFPAAWAELQGMLNVAISNAFTPDTTMDDHSRAIITNFSQAIKPEFMTRDTLEELFVRFARELSTKFPAAYSELQSMLGTAIAQAYVPDTTMDNSSKSAIAGFALAVKPESMTREEINELFVRFAREVSINFPAAWSELQGMLNQALPNAFAPDTTMDDSSKSALAGFALAIKPEFMTRDELNELFVRFAREVSINFPAAFSELQGMLNQALPNAFAPDNTKDDSSEHAVAGFALAVKPESMTREDLNELFVRFAREISINFPAAWAELQGMLNQALPNAFRPDTTKDAASENALHCFALAIKPEVMTRDELCELFIRFVREVSINYPAIWEQMQGMLSQSVAHAFIPDTTIDDHSKELVDTFQEILHNQDLSKNQLDNIFADYMRQVSLNFSSAKKMLDITVNSKSKSAEGKDKAKAKSEKDYVDMQKDFNKVSMESQIINIRAQNLTKDLKNATTKEEIDDIIREMSGLEIDKNTLDVMYSEAMMNIGTHRKASEQIKDTYIQQIDLEYVKKDDRELLSIQSESLTNWDMLRTLRRGEVLNVINELPQEELAESLYVVPKYLLKQALIQLPAEDMARVLFNARFPEALLRSMPRNKAIELLPSAEEMIPIVMNMGNIAGYKNGCDLIEDVITKGLKVEGQQNETRTQEELIPFMEEQLIGKTPRNADAVKPVLGKQNPVQKIMQAFKRDEMSNIKAKTPGTEKEQMKLKYDKPESLKPMELTQLSKESISNMNKDENLGALAAKRGSSEEIMQFLESLKKVKDLASAKSAVSVLTVSQTKTIAKAILPVMETKHIVKVSQMYGQKSSEELVKEMPRYALTGLIKTLPKHFMIQGFKLLDKSMITGMLRTQSSQTIARVASELLSRDAVKDSMFNKQGFTGG